VLGGSVRSGGIKEYGSTGLTLVEPSAIFEGVPMQSTVWMSHGDEVAEVPTGFRVTARSSNGIVAAMSDEARRIFGMQFHVEVTHTEYGMAILECFVRLCDPAAWHVEDFVEHVSAQVRSAVSDRKVFMLVSGGVDSTVAFTLLNNVLGPERVQGLLVDTGLMRRGEVRTIQAAFAAIGVTNLHVEDASEEFFANLEGVCDPEQKRRVIGDTFLAVQKRVSEDMHLRVEDGWMLGQGTIYPDTIETKGTAHADHIKTHHNRVPAIQEMIEQDLVVEPLRELYKDDVRSLGERLGLPRDLVWRHPFPGPGLGVRILCAAGSSSAYAKASADTSGSVAVDGLATPHTVLPVRSVGVQGDGRTYRRAVAFFARHPCRVTPEQSAWATAIPNVHREINRVLLCVSHDHPVAFSITPGFVTRRRADLLREADAIATEEVRAAGLQNAIWQFPVVLLPCGVQKGMESIVLRPVASVDAMTAEVFVLPEATLAQMTRHILSLPGIDAVFLDLTSKPPATIEWE
jgi:GMP synthase (glutamine-hydrolysing)